jgi:uncharacterized protein
MNPKTEYFFIPGQAGQMECALDLPDPDLFPTPIGVGLVAHPHPLFGGTMDNKVAQTLVRIFISLGYATARVNFRGVGKSEGVHDNGIGETDDMLLLHAHMTQKYPNLPVALGGFSFGTFVQARVQHRLQALGAPATRMVLVGTAAGKWDMPTIPANTILVHGELDETIPILAVYEWLRPQEIPLIVIPGADHFFHRRLQHIRDVVLKMWDKSEIVVN